MRLFSVSLRPFAAFFQLKRCTGLVLAVSDIVVTDLSRDVMKIRGESRIADMCVFGFSKDVGP
jgi:hypothetical protein